MGVPNKQKITKATHKLNYPHLASLKWGIPKTFKDLGTLPVQRGWLAIQITEVSLRDNHTYSSFYVSKRL